MDKTLFLEIENIFESNKIVYKFALPYSGNTAENYSYSVIKQFFDLLKHYNVEINKNISRSNYYFETNKDNSINIYLNIFLNEGQLSKSHIRNNIGVLQRVKTSPSFITVYGLKLEHLFTVYNIDNKINENLPGIYLFTMQVEDSRPNIEFSHAILKFESIEKSNKEAISFAKANGALHFLYYSCDFENKRQEIIEDIKQGENYQHQISLLPNTEFLLENVH